MNYFLGKKVNKRVIRDTINAYGKRFEIIETNTQYEYGQLSEKPFDGCYNDNYTFTNNTLAEVYHLILGRFGYKIINEVNDINNNSRA